MRLKKIRFENFRSFTHHEITLPSTPILIIFDKNGSGKSTIHEGVLWGLTGEIVRYNSSEFGSIDALYSLRAKKNARTKVLLEFENKSNQDIYLAINRPKRSKTYLTSSQKDDQHYYFNNQRIPKDNFYHQITKELGIDPVQFQTLNYLAQEIINEALIKDDNDRANAFSKLLAFDWTDEIIDAINSEQFELKNHIKKLNQLISQKSSQLEETELNKLWYDFQNNIKLLESQGLQLRNHGIIVNQDYFDRLEKMRQYLTISEKLTISNDDKGFNKSFPTQHQRYITMINQVVASLNQEVGKINEKLVVVNNTRNILIEEIKRFQKDNKQLGELTYKKKEYEITLADIPEQKKVKKQFYTKNETLLIELDTRFVNIDRLYKELLNLFNQFTFIAQTDTFYEDVSHNLISTTNKVTDHVLLLNTRLQDLKMKKDSCDKELETINEQLFKVKSEFEKNSNLLQELHDILMYIEKTKAEIVTLVEHFSEIGIITLTRDNIFSKESQNYLLDSLKLKIDEIQKKLLQDQVEKTNLEENSKQLYQKNLEYRENLVNNADIIKVLQDFRDRFNTILEHNSQILYPYLNIETLNQEILHYEKIKENLKKEEKIYEEFLIEGEKRLSESQRIEKDLIDLEIAIESFPEKDTDGIHKHIEYGKQFFQSIQVFISEELPIHLIEESSHIIRKLKQTITIDAKEDELVSINLLEKISSDIEQILPSVPWQNQIKQLEKYILSIRQNETNTQKQTILTNQISTLKHEIDLKKTEYTHIEQNLETSSAEKEHLQTIPDRSKIAKIGSSILVILGLLSLLSQNNLLIFIGSITGFFGVVCLVLLFNPKYILTNSLRTLSNTRLQLVPITYRYQKLDEYNNEIFEQKKVVQQQMNEKKYYLTELEQSYQQLQNETDFFPTLSVKNLSDANNSLQAYQKFTELFKWLNDFKNLLKLFKQKYVYRDTIHNKKNRLNQLTQSYIILMKNNTLEKQSPSISSNSLVELVATVEVQFKQRVDYYNKIENDIQALYYKQSKITSLYSELDTLQKELSSKFAIQKEGLPEKILSINHDQDKITKNIDTAEKLRFENIQRLEDLNRNITTHIDLHRRLKDAQNKIATLMNVLASKNNLITKKYNVSIDGIDNRIISLEQDQNHYLQSIELLNNRSKDVQNTLKNIDSEIHGYDAKLQQLTNIQMNIKTLNDSIEKEQADLFDKYAITIENTEDLKSYIQSLRGQQEVLNHEIDLIDQKIDEHTLLLADISRNHASLEIKLATEQKELQNNLQSFGLQPDFINSNIETLAQAIQQQFTVYEKNKFTFLEKIKEVEYLKTELELIAKHIEMAGFIQKRWIEKQEFVVELENTIDILNTRLAKIIDFSNSLETLSSIMQTKTEDLSKDIINTIRNDLGSYFNALGGHALLKSLNLEFHYIRNKLNLELAVGVDKTQTGSPKALFSNGEQISLVLALFFALIKQALPHLHFKWVGLDEPTQYLDYSRKKAFVTFICDFIKQFENIQMVITTADRELITIVEELQESNILVSNVKQLKSSTFLDLPESNSSLDILPELTNAHHTNSSEDIIHPIIEKEYLFLENITKPHKISSSITDITQGRVFTCKICKNNFLALTYQNTCNNSRCINEYKNSLFL